MRFPVPSMGQGQPRFKGWGNRLHFLMGGVQGHIVKCVDTGRGGELWAFFAITLPQIYTICLKHCNILIAHL